MLDDPSSGSVAFPGFEGKGIYRRKDGEVELTVKGLHYDLELHNGISGELEWIVEMIERELVNKEALQPR